MPEITLAASQCGFDIQHLPVTIVTAGWTCDVRRHLAAAFGAVLENRGMPTFRTTAHFLSAFGLAALWYGHGFAIGLGLILEVLEMVQG